MTAYIGFQDLRTLPLKRGDMVKIPKGVVVHTHKGPKVSGRVQVVEVNHILDGSTVFAGRVGVSFERGNHSVAAVCDAGDESGIRSGLDHCQCFFTEAVSLIREATENWDLRNLIGKNSSCS